jgi:hypothetical protein
MLMYIAISKVLKAKFHTLKHHGEIIEIGYWKFKEYSLLLEEIRKT